jgi:hypothetical protein
MNYFNTLRAELNPFCHLLALLGAHPILHVSRIRVKQPKWHLKYMRNEAMLCWRVVDDTSYRLLPVASATLGLFGTLHTLHMRIYYLWSLVLACSTTASTWPLAQVLLGQPIRTSFVSRVRQNAFGNLCCAVRFHWPIQNIWITGQHDKFPRNHRSGSDQYCFSLPVGLFILQKHSALNVYPQARWDSDEKWGAICKERKKKVKLTLEQATKAQSGSRGIDLLFLEPQR